MSNSAGGEKSSRLRGTLRYTGPSAPPAPQPEPPQERGEGEEAEVLLLGQAAWRAITNLWRS